MSDSSCVVVLFWFALKGNQKKHTNLHSALCTPKGKCREVITSKIMKLKPSPQG